MHETWLRKVWRVMRGPFPTRYHIEGATWWSWRGRQYLYREPESGVGHRDEADR